MKTVWWLVPLIGALFVLPLMFVVMVAGIVAPAVIAGVACGEGTGDRPAVATGDWRPPFQQRYLTTSTFGRDLDPDTHQWRVRTGQELRSIPGAGPVVAAAAGTVVSVRTDPAYGRIVVLGHRGKVTTRYGHLASIDPRLRAGATVRIGQRLGLEGSTGSSTGLSLYFEVDVDGHPTDPAAFLSDRGAPLDGTAIAPSTPVRSPVPLGLTGDALEGGVGFPLPEPGTPRQDSLRNPPLPIPAGIKQLYVAAAVRYKVPWTLLAGIGMEETGHGRNNHTSSAGAQGLMQFMPATFAAMRVDGDHDGHTDIHSDADSIYTAANYLTRSGVSHGTTGVRHALFAYNHTPWYANDVLYYAHRYGGGTILGDPNDTCPDGTGNPDLPPLANARIATVLGWAQKHTGGPYVFGGTGPRGYDCSSFTQAAYRQIGIRLPRTAAAQRNWLAAGNGTRIPPGHEQPGDLIFWDSYLGPNQIGHVMIVWNPTTKTTIEAHSTRAGIGHFSYANGPHHHIYQIWRVGNITSGAR